MLTQTLICLGTMGFILGPLVVHALWCAILLDGSPFRKDFWTGDPDFVPEPIELRRHLTEAREWAREDATSLRNRVRDPNQPRRSRGHGLWIDSWTFR